MIRLQQLQHYSSRREGTRRPQSPPGVLGSQREFWGGGEEIKEISLQLLYGLSMPPKPPSLPTQELPLTLVYIYPAFSEYSAWALVHVFKDVAVFRTMPWRPSQGPSFKVLSVTLWCCSGKAPRFQTYDSFVLIWHNEKAEELLKRPSFHFLLYLALDISRRELIRELFGHKSLKKVLAEKKQSLYKVEILRNILSSFKENSIYS